MADNLTDGLNELAQGFQKWFKVSNKLTIQDMISLVTTLKDNDNTATPRTILKAISYGIAPKTESIVNVKDKGAKGDGSSDDTIPIQMALDEVKKVGGIVYVPAGTYMIKAHDPEDLITGWQKMTRPSGLKIGSNTTLLLDENAVLKAIPNNAAGYSILHIAYSNNVNVVGGTIQGDKYTHILDTPFNKRNGENFYGEWGDGAVIYGSTNVSIHGVTFKECWGDGIDVYPPINDKNNGYLSQVHNLSVQNCVFDDNRRQGMSLEHLDGAIIENNLFQNTNGTAPSAGLDIEPGSESSEAVRNVTVRHNTFINNTHQGITLYAGPGTLVEMITIDGNTLIDNGNWNSGQLDINNTESVDIRNNRIISHDGSRNFGIYVIASKGVKVTNNYLPNGNIIASKDDPQYSKASGVIVGNFASYIESNNNGYRVETNLGPETMPKNISQIIGDPRNYDKEITHPNTITNESLKFYDFISWGRELSPTDNPDDIILENNASFGWKGDFSFDIDAKLLRQRSSDSNIIHFEKPMFTLSHIPDDQASLTSNPLYLATMGKPIMISGKKVGTLFSSYIVSDGVFDGNGIQHVSVKGIEFGDGRLHTKLQNNVGLSKTVITTVDGKKYAYTFSAAEVKPINPSTPGNIIIPNTSFVINGVPSIKGSREVQLGSTINDNASAWGFVSGLNISDDKAIGLATTPGNKLQLHLYVSKLQNAGAMWLKWDDIDSKTEFTPKLGENIITLPPLEDASGHKGTRFRPVIHPFFDSVTIDLEKSYVEVVAK